MRILITGPECTGKSTLAEALSNRLSIPWFPEYARTYLTKHGPNYDQSDLLRIAQQHVHLYKVFPADQSLILDTYLINFKIWSEYKYQTCPKWILDQLKSTPKFDLVLLTTPDLIWQQDGLRENPENGEDLFDLFQKEMTQLEWDYTIIKGQGEERMESALQQISVLTSKS